MPKVVVLTLRYDTELQPEVLDILMDIHRNNEGVEAVDARFGDLNLALSLVGEMETTNASGTRVHRTGSPPDYSVGAAIRTHTV